MLDKFPFFENLITRIKGKGPIIIGLSIFLTTLLYIFTPFFNPTITITSPPTSFALLLPKDFKEIRLTFDNVSKIEQKYQLTLKPKEQFNRFEKFSTSSVNQTQETIVITNLFKLPNYENHEFTHIGITLWVKNNANLEVKSVRLDDDLIDLEKFFEKNVTSSNKTLNRYNYVRKDISNLLLKYNDPVSNLILTAMAVYLIPLFIELIRKIYRSSSQKDLESFLNKTYSLNSKDELNKAQILFAEKYERDDRWYKVLQIMGPAIGFALTISSLIVGLHPRLKEIQNIEIFFETIQIAMISTFIGLSVRILAIALQTSSNKIFIQADDAFFRIQESLNKINDQ